MNNFKQPGDVLTLTAPAGGVTSGLGYKIGQLFVVAAGDADAAAEFEGKTNGVFELVKNAGEAWSDGDLLYWDDADDNVTTVGAGNMLIGSAVNGGALSAAVLGEVRLNGIGRHDGISDTELEDDAVDTAAIQDLAVTTAKLAADAVDGTKIADDAVDSEHIAAGAIDPEHFAALSVETAAIAASAVTAAKAPVFVSAETAGTGAEQDVAHGLGAVPSLVLVVPTEFADSVAVDIAEGAHDATNLKITTAAAVKFKVLAWA